MTPAACFLRGAIIVVMQAGVHIVTRRTNIGSFEMAAKRQSEFTREMNRRAQRRTHALMLGALGVCVSAPGHAQTVMDGSAQFNDQRDDGASASATESGQAIAGSECIVNSCAQSPSAALGYAFSTFRTSGQGAADTQNYSGFTAGASIGNWQVRERGALQSITRPGTSYQNIAAYLQRDIPSLKGQLVLGDAPPSADDSIASNIATANQTEGAERLMLFMNAVPMKVYARNSVVSWSDVERGNGHH
ncbi:P pilus assembly protein, porin PapC [Burkholderia sp. Ch1-1]|uniref:P pilus assembly protein, porin PapC n=2 Tax=Paraburkholderia dioscoreae TaxID=2604047 RepID=A0A5Q4YYG1_9BURK|nr:P pilus assembly protein, porin PapC [Burkholderia sp. Ch1-1]VVD33944.1 P pilus assembly protein, porin PapC [Paraburkholderia dioscoreae]